MGYIKGELMFAIEWYAVCLLRCSGAGTGMVFKKVSGSLFCLCYFITHGGNKKY
jgi:hypothetical protein